MYALAEEKLAAAWNKARIFDGGSVLLRLYLRLAVCASRQERHFPGALLIPRELSLARPVGLDTRRPPTL